MSAADRQQYLRGGLTLTVSATGGIDGNADVDLVPVRLRGRLTPDGGDEVTSALAALLGAGTPVLLDLTGLVAEPAGAVTAIADALDRAGGWPGARLTVCTSDPALRRALRATGVDRRVPVAETVAQASGRRAERPAVVSARWEMSPDPSALSRLRAQLRARLVTWGLDGDDVEDPQLVASELVSNAVEHAATALCLTLVLDGPSLTIRVRDGSPRAPQLRPHDRSAHRGRGLQVVEALCASWGCTSHPDGKTIWAILPIVPF